MSRCTHKYVYHDHCAAHVCVHCGHHRGLVLCYCGWPDGHGREHLEAMGEVIDDPDAAYDFDEG